MSLPPSDRSDTSTPLDSVDRRGAFGDIGTVPDQLSIIGLRYDAHHGWYDSERDPSGNKNSFEVDVIVRGWFRDAEELSKVPDYEAMDGLIREVLHGPSEKLIETLCQRIGEAVKGYLEKGRISYQDLEVAVRKCPPPIQTPSRYAEIRMHWGAGQDRE